MWRSHLKNKMNKFKEKFNKVAVPGMNKKFGYKNALAAPKIIKVVVSAGIGSFKDEAKKEVLKIFHPDCQYRNRLSTKPRNQ